MNSEILPETLKALAILAGALTPIAMGLLNAWLTKRAADRTVAASEKAENAVLRNDEVTKETRDEVKTIHMLCNGTHMNALKAAASYARQVAFLRPDSKEAQDAATDAERALYEHMVAEATAKEFAAEKAKQAHTPEI